MNSTSKKKILYVITKSSWGGAQKYVYDLACEFRDEYEVHVAYGENEFGQDNFFEQKLYDAGITTHPLRSMKKKVSLLGEWRTIQELRSIINALRPHVVHLNSSKMAIIGSWVSRWCSVPVIIYTAHGFPFVDTSRGAWKNKIIEYITRMGLLAVDHIITISQRESDIVKKWRYSTHKNHLIYNGLKPIEMLPREVARNTIDKLLPAHIKNKIKEGAVVIGSIAELRANKGTEYLIKSLADLLKHDTQWVYLHFGTGSEQEMLEKKIEQLGLRDRVCLLGFVEKASQYLLALDLFVLPSLQEGTPYVIVEAGQAALPVVATDVGAVREMVVHEVSGLLEKPGCSACLTEALSCMLDNEQQRLEYAQALQDSVFKRFSFRVMVDETRKVYLA